MSERQLSKSTVNRQLPKGRVDGVDASELTQVDVVDGKVDADSGAERNEIDCAGQIAG